MVVYIIIYIYLYIYILYGGGGPPGPKNARADFFVPVQPWFTLKFNLSLFTHSHVVPNRYSFISSAEHKRRHFEEYG